MAETDGFHRKSHLNDVAEGREAEVQAAHAAAATDEDAIGVLGGRNRRLTGPRDAVEEGNGERGAIAGDDGEEAVDGADRGRPGLREQFVEQVERVVGADVPGEVPFFDEALQAGPRDGADGEAGATARRGRGRGI